MKKFLIILMAFFMMLVFVKDTKASEASSLEQFIDQQEEGSYYQVNSDVVCFWSNLEGVYDLKLPGSDTETYNPKDRQWVGIPYITVTNGGRIYVSYMTGGFLEPHEQNYSVIYYSDDGGETFNENFLIIDNLIPENHWYAPKPFYDSETGRMFMYLGVHVFYTDDADCENPVTDMKFSKTYNMGRSFSHCPVKVNGIYVNDVVASSKDDKSVIKIWGSRNGIKWEEIASVSTSSPSYKKFHEGGICTFGEEGILLLSRLDGGTGLERSYSYDGGYTWTDMETDFELPLATSYTKCALFTLPSGAILLVNNNSTEARLNMTAYLSYDNGYTWPYQLELDGRYGFEQTYWGVSYPDIHVTKDGTIWIVWDERDPINEISLAKLTEADIKAGEIVTEGSYSFKTMFRNSNYYDMTSIEEEIDHYVEVKVGTSEDEITTNLPTLIHYKDAKGNSLETTGSWVCDNYDSKKLGYYTFRFEMDSKDPYLIMSDQLCKVYVKVIEENKGCNSSISVVFPIILLPMAIVAFKRKKDQ